MASRTIENYLKQLYLEEQHVPSGEPVATGKLAQVMGVVPGTATTMVKALADAGLVRYSPRSGVQLTEEGNQLALHVLRRHRLVELFLVRVVGLDWSEVHAEAEELEHVISEKLLGRMDALLGHPTVDPHGDPIPTAGGEMITSGGETLATCPIGEWVEIARVLDQEPGFLVFVEKNGLVPGSRVRMDARDEHADSVKIERERGQMLMVSGATACKFVVRLL